MNNIDNILVKLNYLLKEFNDKIKNINNINDLNNYKSEFIGKKSFLYFTIKNINKFNNEIKIIIGKKINFIKNEINKNYYNKKEELIKLNNKEINIDINVLTKKYKIGSFHPISITLLEIEEYFNNIGFTTFNYNELENSYYNFDALNIPINHPSRNYKDTFWIKDNILLRTHTSCSQIRFFENRKPPYKIISYGKVFRNDKDSTHSPMFHQLDGFLIDKNINLKLLKNIIEEFIKYFFNNKNLKIKFRHSYFPFTEPSIEVDILNNLNKWIEIIGCGLIHRNVLKNLNINYTKYSGLAFGIGIERLIMLRYNINNIKILFENNLTFLNQFSYMR